jgi:hypothetical protein
MRKHLHFRLRSAMIVVALLSLPLAYRADVWRRGEFAFQRHHASLANAWYARSWRFYFAAKYYYPAHAARGHSCLGCRHYVRPVDELISEAQRLQQKYQHEAEWHRFWAGQA